MPQSLAQIYLHLIWSTKQRAAFLRDRTLREDLYVYMQGICANQGCPSLQIGGVEDHVHVLCRFGRGISVSDLLRELKRDSSKWVKDRAPGISEFQWQNGYGAFSISATHVDALKHYIATQEEHHRRKESFQDEFRRICGINGIEVDERYVWD